jgi:hypothetical protein
METGTDGRVTHLYIDTAIQLLLLVTFLYSAAVADTDIFSAMAYYAFSWSVLTIAWQAVNALIIKFYFEQDSRDSFLKLFAWSLLIILGTFAATWLLILLDLFFAALNLNLLSWAYPLLFYMLYFLWFMPIFFAVFVLYYYFLTARDIANRFGNTAY